MGGLYYILYINCLFIIVSIHTYRTAKTTAAKGHCCSAWRKALTTLMAFSRQRLLK